MPAGRPIELRGPLGDLAEAMGGRLKLAEALGVSKGTINRYSNGEIVPRKPTRVVLALLAKQHGTEPPYSTEDPCPRPAWLDAPEDDDE